MNRSASFLALTMLAGIVSAQTVTAPAFETASIKPSQNRGFGRMEQDADHVSYPGCPLKYLIGSAYGITEAQISGPAWLDDAKPGDPTGRFDLVATVPASAPRDRARLIGLMLQGLLKERFQLEAHHEQKTMQAYEIVVGDDGPKMHQAAAGDPAKEVCLDAYVAGGPNVYQCHLAMADLPPVLNEIMQEGVPVVDRTGLTPVYDFRLAWAGRMMIRMGRASGPDIYGAMEQLGLKLHSTIAPVDVLVIDHVEKQPTGK